MASMANQLSLVLLLTILSSLNTHARDSQFFNKVPSSTTTTPTATPTNVVPKAEQPQQQDPNFQPENENNYGLYGHESGQLPPSATGTTTTTLPPSKYLPKNYNPVAYVTVPENTNDNVDDSKFYNNNENYNNGAQNYYDGRHEEDRTAGYRSYPTTANNLVDDSNNFYDNDGGSRFSSQPFGDTKYDNGGAADGFQPQGLSDTRSLENGKYFYDLSSEKYSNSHPYESLKGARRDYYGNGGTNNEFGQFSRGNAFEGYYHNQNDRFPQELNIP